jgi:dihydropyrimidine dehydrogenase (NAD+) subunit PreA
MPFPCYNRIKQNQTIQEVSMGQRRRKASEPSLDVIMAGVHFRSPIGVAAVGNAFGKELYHDPKVHAEANAKILLDHVRAGAGYVYLQFQYITDATLKKLRERARPEETHYIPRKGFQPKCLKVETPVAPYGVEGMHFVVSPFWNTAEMARNVGPGKEMILRILKEKLPEGVPIIANVSGQSDCADTYVDPARRAEELGADLVEINFSCPMPAAMSGAVDDFFQNRFPARFQGSLIGEDPDLVGGITRAVVDAVRVPVGAKLSPEIGFPRIVGIAKAIRDAGAKYVQVVNSGIGIAPPDIYNRGKSPWPFADGNFFTLASGPWLRMICYKDVAAIARFVPGIDIAASGGLVTPEHMVEVMMLGARHAQLCTGVIEQGRSLIRRSNDFMRNFMAEQGYNSVEELIGLGQEHIKFSENVNFMSGQVISELDHAKCSKCGRCIDGICLALYVEKGKIKVDPEKCAGCGGCIVTCPNDAFRLVLRP